MSVARVLHVLVHTPYAIRVPVVLWMYRHAAAARRGITLTMQVPPADVANCRSICRSRCACLGNNGTMFAAAARHDAEGSRRHPSLDPVFEQFFRSDALRSGPADALRDVLWVHADFYVDFARLLEFIDAAPGAAFTPVSTISPQAEVGGSRHFESLQRDVRSFLARGSGAAAQRAAELHLSAKGGNAKNDAKNCLLAKAKAIARHADLRALLPTPNPRHDETAPGTAHLNGSAHSAAVPAVTCTKGWTDLLYLPAELYAEYRRYAADFAGISLELAVPTVLSMLNETTRAPSPERYRLLSCAGGYGAPVRWIDARRAVCAHKVDLEAVQAELCREGELGLGARVCRREGSTSSRRRLTGSLKSNKSR